jgi:hypothetical protein
MDRGRIFLDLALVAVIGTHSFAYVIRKTLQTHPPILFGSLSFEPYRGCRGREAGE